MRDFQDHNHDETNKIEENAPSEPSGYAANHKPVTPQDSAGSTPYRAPHSPGQVYPPPAQQWQPQRPYQASPNGQYHYNANTGWQPPQPSEKPQEKHEWKVTDYEQLEGKKGDKRRGGAIFMMTACLVGLLSVGIIGLSLYSLYAKNGHVGNETVQETDSVNSSVQDNQLQITSTPKSSESPSSDGRLSIPDVAQAVLPSVVGVVRYDNDQYYESTGYGSGIVMSEDGYIITNAHVVANGTGFKIQFNGGEVYDAEMVGYDLMTDLAVLKIPATGLTPAAFGDSDELKVGETVVAVGNPGGDVLASTVTRGIVSAINREVQTTNYRMTYIQVDAAINPGNSGGALANEYGLIVGINSSKIVAEGYEGIGFAIPVATAKPIIDDIIANGRVTGRVVLGITCRLVDEITAKNGDIKMGLMIDSIEPTSDLVNEGVLRGDILTHIDGERIYDFSDLRDILNLHQPGDTVTLSFYRKVGTRQSEYEVRTRLLESA